MTLPKTPSQTVGPYYSIGLSRGPQNRLVHNGVRLGGRLLDGAGDPVDGVIEVWDHAGRRFGRCGTDAEGRFEFVVAKPAANGPDAPRLDVYVFARGLLEHQATRIYFPDEPEANADDPVLSSLDPGDRETLVAVADDGGLRFDVRLQGERPTVFFAL